MDTAQIIELGCLITIFVLSLGLHEYAHAAVAYLCGDDTAKMLGRMTPNPLAHIDPFLTVLLPTALFLWKGILFGGAKPVPVVPRRLRHPLRDMMFVAIAGPLTNLLLALFFMVLLKASVVFWGYEAEELLPRVLTNAVAFNMLLTIFNMLPIPPLDGSRVMAYLLPQPLRETYVGLERYGMLLVVAFVFIVPGVQQELRSATLWMVDLAYDVTGGNWRR